MSEEITPFFENYAQAMQSFDADALAHLYTLPCLFAYQGGQTCYREFEALLSNMQTVVGFYQEQGLVKCHQKLTTIALPSSHFVLATVIWQLDWSNGKSSNNKTLFQLTRSQMHPSSWQATMVTALT